LANLEKGIFKSQGETITKKDKLLIIKQELELKRKALEKALQNLKTSATYQKIADLEDWKGHFLKSQQQFENILETLEIKYSKLNHGQ
jgi:inorganic pyrophosphatase